jgi:membrane protease YdiL (CAAX protease family)
VELSEGLSWPAPAGEPVAPPRERDAFAFIDLARLGRTDWWSGLKGFFKLIGWQLLIGVVLGVAMIFLGSALTDGFRDVAILAAAALAWFIGLGGAVRRSQGRPLMSLIAADRRLRPGRVALGALLWLAASVILAAAALPLQAAFSPSALTHAAHRFAWPVDRSQVIAACLSIALFPLQAAGEEMAFRGWLTQTLGQFLRRPWLVALLVGFAFALAHGFLHGPYAFPYYVIMSMGLSALTRLDQRLELAIGAHAANNTAVVGAALFLSGGSPPSSLLFNTAQATWMSCIDVFLTFAVIYAMARWLLRRGEAAVA